MSFALAEVVSILFQNCGQPGAIVQSLDPATVLLKNGQAAPDPVNPNDVVFDPASVPSNSKAGLVAELFRSI